ncbi:MAG: Holliday junction branch migration protein RuvA [Cellulosilyticaceae bacterium]
MLAYIKGIITEVTETSVYVEIAGIAYEVYIAASILGRGMKMNEEVKIYVYDHIKEDAHDLYGFTSREEKELFKKLISVSGIGPKGAMNIFNLYQADEVIQIILNQDSKALGKVTGIGPKTAQRIILELKDAIGKIAALSLDTLPIFTEPTQHIKGEAIEALEALGYGQTDAKKAVEAIWNYEDSVEDVIKKALSLLMS